jgi:hypothetical protein
MIQPNPNQAYAVVMGDIVGSEAANSIAALHIVFNEAVKASNKQYKLKIVSPLTITLGDEFQGLATSLSAGLRVVRFLRHHLLARKVECRFVLGLAQLESPVNRAKSWNMMGPGLSNARQKLDDKRLPNAYRFSFPEDPVLETILDAVGLSITDIENGWTPRQFEIAQELLANNDLNAALASRLGVALRTLYKIRHAARMDLYESQWAAIDTVITDLDKRNELE